MRTAPSKDALRRGIQERRLSLTDAQWADADARRSDHLLHALGNQPGSIALYASRPAEPGTRAIIDSLYAAGWRILLPLLGGAPRWAPFMGWGHMRAGWGGIPEPVEAFCGTAPLAEADLVVIACLAVAADGSRLGTGGGWYDRALLHRAPGKSVWALAQHGELMGSLPVEDHDVPVDAVITEQGLLRFGSTSLPGISAK